MEIRPILSALLRSKTGAAADRAPGRAQPRDPRQRAVHRATCAMRRRRAPERHRRREQRVPHRRAHRCKGRAHSEATGAAASATPTVLRAHARRGVGDLDQPDADVALGLEQRLVARPQAGAAEPSTRRLYFAPPTRSSRRCGLKLVEGRDFTPDDMVEIDPDKTPDEHGPHVVHRHQGRWPTSCIPAQQRGRQDALLRHRRRRTADAHRRRGRTPADAVGAEPAERGELLGDRRRSASRSALSRCTPCAPSRASATA